MKELGRGMDKQGIVAGRDTGIVFVAVLLAAATVGLELVIPLGYTVWLLYFLAIGVTLFLAAIACVLLVVGFNIAPPSDNSAFSVVNRTGAAICFITTALIVMQAIRARLQAERALWLQEAENAVALVLQGDQTPQMVAEAALRELCRHTGSQTGVLYQLEGQSLALVGGVALARDVPARIAAGNGQIWEVVEEPRPRLVRGLGAAHVVVESALGQSPSRELLLAPVTADGAPNGALELGRTAAGVDEDLALELVRRCSEKIGVALRTARLRAELIELLEETQRQSEELQAQQEELRVANEELEEQSRTLQQSQVNLEQQQAELEATNVQLEERTHELEAQRQYLLAAQ